jgi:hypothetical protein
MPDEPSLVSEITEIVILNWSLLGVDEEQRLLSAAWKR